MSFNLIWIKKLMTKKSLTQ